MEKIVLKVKEYDAFRFIESDEYDEDDIYELIDDENIYIQVSDDYVAKYLVHQDFKSHSKCYDIFYNLNDAKQKALSIWYKKIVNKLRSSK